MKKNYISKMIFLTSKKCISEIYEKKKVVRGATQVKCT